MIVKDSEESIKKASDIAGDMIAMFATASEKFVDHGDPAEQIYLAAHVVGQINARFAAAMDGYSKIYDINNFDGSIFRAWTRKIEEELSAMGENISEDDIKEMRSEKV